MKILDYIEELLLVVGLSLMVIINFGNVISRYIIHASWAFSEELMVYLFVYNSFIGASVAFKRNSHLGVTLLIDKLPLNGKRIMIILSMILIIGLMGILTYYSLLMVQNQIIYDQRTPALGMPEWIAGMAAPLGAILIIIRVIQRTLITLKTLKKNQTINCEEN